MIKLPLVLSATSTEPWPAADPVRDLERRSIREWMTARGVDGTFAGKTVLDFGCGKQPYRGIIEGGQAAEYHGFDADKSLGFTEAKLCCDVIVLNQVVQYLPNLTDLLKKFYIAQTCLRPDSEYHAAITSSDGEKVPIPASPHQPLLVITYPTCWPEVEPTDLQRFTKTGMEMLIGWCGYKPVRHDRRAEVRIGEFVFPLGYGLVAEYVDGHL